MLQNLEKYKITSTSETGTFNIGRSLSNQLFQLSDYKLNSRVVLLEGDLGYGKTQFVKGMAAGMQIEAKVNSPTYTYINEYISSNGKKLVHIDAWRVDSDKIAEALKVDSYFNLESVIAIEWPANLSDYIDLPATSITVRFEYLAENSRLLTIIAPSQLGLKFG